VKFFTKRFRGDATDADAGAMTIRDEARSAAGERRRDGIA